MVLFVLLAGAGIGTAYAGIVLPTITLDGNVVVTGDTTLQGELTSSEYSYSSPQTRTLMISPFGATPGSGDVITPSSAGYIQLSSGGEALFSVNELPVGATITKLTCLFFKSGTQFGASFSCFLYERPELSTNPSIMASTISSVSSADTSPNIRSMEDITIVGASVDEKSSYYLTYEFSGTCTTTCRFYGAEIEYTVTKPD